MVHDLIRLFSAEATEFESNGLGSLFEATKCTVKEEANGSFELTLEYPIWGKRFNDLICRNIIVAKTSPYSDPQAFRIYGITKPMNGLVTYSAQHISYDLSGYPVTPFTANSCLSAFEGLKSHSLKEHNFTFWTDKTTEGEFKVEVPSSTRSLLGGTEGSILDTYHGDYEFDNFTVKLHNKRGNNRGVTIRYGKNMTDFDQEENISKVYTSVYPYWKGTNDDDEDILFELPEKIIEVEGEYKFVNVLIQDFSGDFDSEPTAEEFRKYVTAWIKENNIGVPDVSFEVSFFQLSQSLEYQEMSLLEQVELFDTVKVEFENLNVSASAKVNAIEYNALTDRYETISLGSIRASISDTVVNNQQSIVESENRTATHMEKAIENATKWITNGRGFMVAVKDEAGNWMEICSLDEPSIEKAKNVWRWNNGGFGFSGNGYNGPYTVAITQDGHIVADFIDTGNLNATVINTGILQDYSGDVFYLDLDAGVLKMKPTNLFIGNSNLEDTIGDIDSKFEDVDKNLEKWYNDAIKYADDIVGEAKTEQEEEWKAAIGNAMLQESIFNALTDNGKVEGLVLKNGQLYINASFIASGDYVVGGYNNVSGTIQVRNASGQNVVILDNTGITLDSSCKISWGNISGAPLIPSSTSQLKNDSGYITSASVPTDAQIIQLINANKKTIITDEYIATLHVVADELAAGTTIKCGGFSNQNGKLIVYDVNGVALVTLDNKGITLAANCKIGWSNISGAPAIPSKTSELANDSSYATTSQIPTKVSQLSNDKNYATTSQIPTVPKKLSQLENDMDFIAENAIPTDAQIVNLITKNRGTIITKEYIGTLKVVAGSVSSGSVTSSTITGSTISGTSISGGTISGTTISGSTLKSVSGSTEVRIVDGKVEIRYDNSYSGRYTTTNGTEYHYNVDDPSASIATLVTGKTILTGSGNLYLGSTQYSISIEMQGTKAYLSANTEVWGTLTAKGKITSFVTPIQLNSLTKIATKQTYSQYSTSSVISDIGEGLTDSEGICCIYIDDVLSEIGNPETEYQVFLQKEGPGDIWVSDKNPMYFTVEGTPNLKFAWEIKIKNRGQESSRLDDDISAYEDSVEEDLSFDLCEALFSEEEQANDDFANLLLDIDKLEKENEEELFDESNKVG